MEKILAGTQATYPYPPIKRRNLDHRRRASYDTADVHVGQFALLACGDWFLWPGDRLLYLGRPGAFWLSETESGGQSHDGNVGFLDAGIHAVHYRRVSGGWHDVVRSLR